MERYAARTDAVSDAFAPEVVTLKVSHGNMKNNNYVVVDPISRHAVLIDPAWEMGTIASAVSKAGAHVRGILITHAHFDHIHLADPLSELYGCPVWMSAREIAASGFSTRRLVAITERPWFVGNMRIEPILTPGHTPGCVCYLIDGHLFSGDVLFAEGCGICKDEDAAHDMFDSLQSLKNQLAPATRIFPGHTYVRPPGQTLAELLRCNLYLNFNDKHAFAAFRLRKGQNAKALFDFR